MRAIYGVVALVGALSIFPAATTSATSITFTTVNTEQTTFTQDFDGKGLSAGDYQTFIEKIVASNGTSGNSHVFCIYFSANDANCTTTFGFGSGNSIELQGFLSGSKQTMAVVGGNGKYVGAHGSAVITKSAPPVTDFTITINGTDVG